MVKIINITAVGNDGDAVGAALTQALRVHFPHAPPTSKHAAVYFRIAFSSAASAAHARLAHLRWSWLGAARR